ncbi:MAG: fatty acid desaturase [Pirellulales bacterium]|nr:fatty acid desaturase [Pirellulales bacterium]
MCPNAQCPTKDGFSIREARAIVKDLFEPRPVIYWADFLVSVSLAHGCFLAVSRLPLFSVWQACAFVVSCLAIYRAALFTHELVHLPRERFKVFRVAWNVLCGIPFLLPSFLYWTHVAHHARKHYGTREDGEYLPLAAGPLRGIAAYLAQPLVIPLLAVLRFLILTPLGWISPRFRRWVHQRASSMVMDPSYVRPLPTPRELRWWRVQETTCFLYTLGTAVLIIAGRVSPWLLVQGYLTAVTVITLNAVRTMGAHRFRHTGEELSFLEQLLDSINYPRWPLVTELWAPVGLRFHALHHLFPSLPYHNLSEAHRRLMAQLPENSPYRATNSPGLIASLVELIRASAEYSRRARGLAGNSDAAYPVAR